MVDEIHTRVFDILDSIRSENSKLSVIAGKMEVTQANIQRRVESIESIERPCQELKLHIASHEKSRERAWVIVSRVVVTGLVSVGTLLAAAWIQFGDMFSKLVDLLNNPKP